MVTGSGLAHQWCAHSGAIAMVIAPASNGRAAVRRRLVQQAADFAVPGCRCKSASSVVSMFGARHYRDAAGERPTLIGLGGRTVCVMVGWQGSIRSGWLGRSRGLGALQTLPDQVEPHKRHLSREAGRLGVVIAGERRWGCVGQLRA